MDDDKKCQGQGGATITIGREGGGRRLTGMGGRGRGDGNGWGPVGGGRRATATDGVGCAGGGGGGATTTYGGGARFWSLGARLFWRARVFFGALLFLPVTMVGTLNYE